MQTRPKILFTTAAISRPRGWFDWFQFYSPTLPRIVAPLNVSPGLRFIGANLPQIEILEYPTWGEYEEKLSQGYDAVGISFYTSEHYKAVKMAEMARQKGVSQVWAGNYGAMDPGISECFDRVFLGYAEHQLAELLGTSIPRLLHPPLVFQMDIRPLPFKVQRMGAVQTQRGCPMQCTYCQTPTFCPELSTVPLESLDEVLAWYKTHGVDWVLVIDENFGVNQAHSEGFLELVQKHGLCWSVMSKADIALKHLDTWCQTRLMGIGVGIESLNPQTLADWKKQQSAEACNQLKEALFARGRYMWAYYLVGHEAATCESTWQEMEDLYNLGIGNVLVTIATPFPNTPMWDDLEARFGIFEKDWTKFDTNHLVWNHPRMRPEQLERLRELGTRLQNRPARFSKFMHQIMGAYRTNLGSHAKALAMTSTFPYKSYRYNRYR